MYARMGMILAAVVLAGGAITGMAGAGYRIRTSYPDRPGGKDVLRVNVVDVVERGRGAELELAVCWEVKPLPGQKQSISADINLLLNGRVMRTDGHRGAVDLVELAASDREIFISRIGLMDGEGSGSLSELMCEIRKVRYSDR